MQSMPTRGTPSLVGWRSHDHNKRKPTRNTSPLAEANATLPLVRSIVRDITELAVSCATATSA